MGAARPTASGARVLLTGWFSFLHGEVTAGDLLAEESVRRALWEAAVEVETAWSPVFWPEALHLVDADPADFSHLVFVCGPVHSTLAPDAGSSPLLELHARFARCRRLAVGVSVTDPSDPAVTGFHDVLPRDAPHVPVAAVDLSVQAPRADPPPPLVGVILTEGQHEYGPRRLHARVSAALTRWLASIDVAAVALDTRLDTRDWRLPSSPEQLHAALARLDAVVTTRLHGLVLALRAGTPALAVDPVAGGAKVSAQAAALDWPAVLRGERLRTGDLDRALTWCLSPHGRARAGRYAGEAAPSDLLTGLVRRVVDRSAM
ncbi:polysaccharide pyruvyl transferase family protein [Streptomyces sp. SAJ15]|uniref:polysaccharide pyruvyl transferase family protein n=1 Tax=Streptomyces sp. SAJ15 TaxID=2011095 RepID=UPI0011862FF4|nr:polysaccharide pyruvyl transferase family protein [Streptomyces sp. SAJ15]TVL89664.1 polysaccharide pyruvyl transferase [Streptomyces sp. SAJ15]